MCIYARARAHVNRVSIKDANGVKSEEFTKKNNTTRLEVLWVILLIFIFSEKTFSSLKSCPESTLPLRLIKKISSCCPYALFLFIQSSLICLTALSLLFIFSVIVAKQAGFAVVNQSTK